MRVALTFLTVIPVRMRGAQGDLGAAAAWFPAVGALIGALAGGVRVVADDPLGPSVAAVLAVVVLVAVTGALHQDGLADCADGLGVRGDTERRLAVMREPATGVFGTLALVLWALLLAATLAALPRDDAFRALVLAAALGRWGAVVHAVACRPARPDGLGAAFRVGHRALAIATVAAVLAAVLVVEPVRGLAALGAAAAVALAAGSWARRALGGRTGDTLGATVAVVEAAICLVLLAFAQ
jgi:adenosylcobinamide-GDP ribazoletransferase